MPMPAQPPMLVQQLESPRPAALSLSVDRRFELLSILFRLAGYDEYHMGRIQAYNQAVDAHFGPFAGHPAVDLARQWREHIGFDAIPALAVRGRDARSFQAVGPLDGETGLDERWKGRDAGAFLALAARFASEARAEDFFERQEPFYRLLLQTAQRQLADQLDQGWFLRTFGQSQGRSFHLCLAPLNGGANYGVRSPRPGGGEDLYAFLGTGAADVGQAVPLPPDALATLVHEFLHSFINPWVERHLAALRPAGVALAAPVAKQMRRQAYGDPETVLKESLVRAWTIAYFQDAGRADLAQATQQEQDRLGFYWVPALVGHLRAQTDGPACIARQPERLVAFLQHSGTQANRLYTTWWDRQPTAPATP